MVAILTRDMQPNFSKHQLKILQIRAIETVRVLYRSANHWFYRTGVRSVK